ncbi:hypothetical protein JCM13304A_08520 [Desulfothermus okinawensis JCM 13304]
MKKLKGKKKVEGSFLCEADYSKVSLINKEILERLKDHGVNKNDLDNIGLILEEITLNICKYAYPGDRIGTIEINFSIVKNYLILIFKDKGKQFNPLEYNLSKPIDKNSSLDELRPGGLGIYLVKEMSHRLSYVYKDSTNILTVIFKLSGNFFL